MKVLRFAAVLLLAQGAFSFSSSQLPPPDVVSGTASIDGIVVTAGTDRPVAGVDVELSRVSGTRNAPIDPRIEAYFQTVLDGAGSFAAAPSEIVAPEVRYVLTGPDGRFSFRDLPGGEYRLVASQGYARGDHYPAEYGQHDPRGRGVSFPVGSGQAIRDLRLEMTLPGTIIGVVQDYDGEPMSYVGILGLKIQYRNGRKILNLEQSVYTNEKGEYRLYWLGPGDYYVAAVVQDPRRRTVRSDPIPPGRRGPTERASSPYVMSRILPTGEVLEETYAVVYNGGVLDAARAPVLRVEPAGLLNADIPMGAGLQSVSHIRGRVIDQTNGGPASGASVRAVPREWSPNLLVLSGTTEADGSFDLAGAVPGTYDVFAEMGSTSGLTVQLLEQLIGAGADISSLLGGSESRVGHAAAQVRGADVNGLSVTAVSGMGLGGQIRVDGNVTDALVAQVTNLRVSVVRDPDRIGVPRGMAPVPQPSVPAAGEPPPVRLNNGQVDASGFFPLYVYPGTYRVEVAGIPSGSYLKAIRLGSTDVLAAGLEISRPTNTPLEVVLGTDGGVVTGVVLDEEGLPLQNAMVALSPESVDLRARTDLNMDVRTSANGTFRMSDIPPGVYRLFAWRFVESGAWMDPAFRSLYDTRGTLVYVEPGSQQQSELTVLPVR